MYVGVVSLDSMCRWQVLVYVYCAPSVQSCCTSWISASKHVFVFSIYRKYRLVCLSLRSIANHPHGRLAKKLYIGATIAGGGRVRYNLHSSL